jgi:hypothetical protein
VRAFFSVQQASPASTGSGAASVSVSGWLSGWLGGFRAGGWGVFPGARGAEERSSWAFSTACCAQVVFVRWDSKEDFESGEDGSDVWKWDQTEG